MDQFAIRVKNINKVYNLNKKHLNLQFRDAVEHLFKKSNACSNNFHALDNVSFDVLKGESVGIIGRNGAGKSTLLKILSEVVEPSSGKILVQGSIASVLEIGMGFHPELTGRENIFLSGSLYGLSKKQIKNCFDGIVEFSGLERFIDTPVKYYSSGMCVRLGFSVVTNIDADILLFDEVLSVGDLSFQLKCKEKIKQLVSSNKTIIIVSHNIIDINELCTRIIRLENGKIIDEGNKNIASKYYEDAIIHDLKINQNIQHEGENEAYNHEFSENILLKEWDNIDEAPGDLNFKIRKMYIVNESNKESNGFYLNNRISVNIEYDKFDDENFYDIGVSLSSMNFLFLGCHTLISDIDIESCVGRGRYRAKVYFEENFFNDALLTVGYVVIKNNKNVVCSNPSILRLKIKLFTLEKEKIFYENIPKHIGPMRPKLKWDLDKI